MKNVRTQAKERSPVCLLSGCCLQEGAAGEEGLGWPSPVLGLRCFVCARIVKDTDVQNPRIIILSQIFNRIGSSQTCIFM